MYGYLSETKQSLALKLMPIYALKSNILVNFSHLNYLLVLYRFKSLCFRFYKWKHSDLKNGKNLAKLRWILTVFIHQSSPFKFAIHFLSVSH